MIEKNKNLLGLQTFGLNAHASAFAKFETESELKAILKAHTKHQVMILGGGSNVLFVQDFSGLLLLNQIKGIRISRRFKHSVYVEVGGGEIWDHLVAWAVEQNFGGLENLSLIPGTVGASPIQNIGAYGVEIKDCFVKCTAIHLKTGKKEVFRLGDCQFGYRNSIFKQAAKGQYCITSVTFRLSTQQHKIKTGYGDVVKQLEKQEAWPSPSIADIRNAVVSIRQSKLPDPAVIGNCGSFFKNPEIPEAQYLKLKSSHENIPGYPTEPTKMKVPAGWLIEACGWKGKRVGNTGCYEKQALVIVNHGGATGSEVLNLVNDIIQSVKVKFDISLEPEVQIIG
jgi:UDP-N-acetylmuramate dehydrogenase